MRRSKPFPLLSSLRSQRGLEQILLNYFRMPVTLTIDPKRQLSITTGAGVVTDEEFIDARQRLLANPDFDPCFDRIWDFHAVSESRVSDEVMARLVAGSPLSEKPICRAVVMSECPGPMKAILDFIGRTRAAHRRIAVFPDLARAEEWVLTARHDLPPE